MFEDMEPIYSYTGQDAVNDGWFAPVFQNRWPELTHGKPIYTTASVRALGLSDAALIEIWNDYVRHVKSKNDTLFCAVMNGEKIWIADNGDHFVFLLPADY